MRPRQWLNLMTQTRATVSFGPPFGYDLCARRLGPGEAEKYDLRQLARGGRRRRDDPSPKPWIILRKRWRRRDSTRAHLLACYGMAGARSGSAFHRSTRATTPRWWTPTNSTKTTAWCCSTRTARLTAGDGASSAAGFRCPATKSRSVTRIVTYWATSKAVSCPSARAQRRVWLLGSTRRNPRRSGRMRLVEHRRYRLSGQRRPDHYRPSERTSSSFAAATSGRRISSNWPKPSLKSGSMVR